MSTVDDDDGEDAQRVPGELLWDLHAAAWGIAAELQERSDRSRFLARPWPLPLQNLPVLDEASFF